jgi:mRNA interferase HicA
MKRVDLIRHLERCGCEFFREGGNHTVYVNRSAGKSSSVPRHREVNDFSRARFAPTFRFRDRKQYGVLIGVIGVSREESANFPHTFLGVCCRFGSGLPAEQSTNGNQTERHGCGNTLMTR